MNQTPHDYSKVNRYHYNQNIQESIYINNRGEQLNQINDHDNFHHHQQNDHHQHNHPHQHPAHTTHRSKLTTIHTKTQSSWLDMFSCCREIVIQQPQYEDCYVCNRRFYNKEHDISTKNNSQSQYIPYMSAIRMKNRQEKPLKIYYDRLNSNDLKNQRWRHL